MNQVEIYGALKDIFSEVFLRDDIPLTAETTAKDVEGWDSFRQIEIVMAVEERFNVKLQTREIDGLKKVGDLVCAIESKVG